MEEVRLYFTAPRRASARASASSPPMFFARCTRSTWSILEETENSLEELLALETALYWSLFISSRVASEKSLRASGTVAESSARSMMERVVCWPRVCWAQTSTKSSMMRLPTSMVGAEVFFESSVSQFV